MCFENRQCHPKYNDPKQLGGHMQFFDDKKTFNSTYYNFCIFNPIKKLEKKIRVIHTR